MITWNERIERARKRTKRNLLGRLIPSPGFNADDLAAAWDWGTCAFGEQIAQHGALPGVRLTMGTNVKQMIPTDELLRSLGSSFLEAVRKNHLDQAETLVVAIQTRIRQLAPQAQVADVEREVDHVLREVSERGPR